MRRTRTGTAAASQDVRSRIFETAEKLFGEQGLEAVSVRDIAAAAGVNLAAINYYFGSRNNLLVEILETRGRELGEERDRLLAGLKQPPTLRDLLRSVMEPLARWRFADSPRHASVMFMSRALTAALPELRSRVDTGILKFGSYVDQLQQVLPDLNREEICWRFHFMMALEHMNIWDEDRLVIFSRGLCKPRTEDESLERALDFAVAGFMAPVTRSRRTRRTR